MPLVFASLITIALAVVLFYFENRTKFGKLHPAIKQTIVGICFGLSAVFATELGSFDIAGAAINARDAAPVTAGLIFGPWAGVLAGIIGAVDRFFVAAPIFGVGVYTQVACSIATLFAGVLAGLVKVTIFRKHRPMVIHGLIIILLIEVLHMSLVPLTHIEDIEQATVIMIRCFGLLLISNSLAVIFSIFLTAILDAKYKGLSIKKLVVDKDLIFSKDLFYSFQFWLLFIIIVAFALTLISTSVLLDSVTRKSTEYESQRDLEIFVNMVDEESLREHVNFSEAAQKVSYYWSDEGEYSIMLIDSKSNNRILTKDIEYSDMPGIVENNEPNKLIECNVNGVDMMVMYTVKGDFKIVQYRLVKNEMFISYFSTMILAFTQITIFGCLLICVFVLLKRLVGNNLYYINKSLEKITAGDLDEKVNVYKFEEFSMLSNSINSTVDTLKEYIKLEANRYNEEFELAQQIQLSALPNVFPAFPDRNEFDLYATYKSAKDVGGDFYDYYFVRHNKLAFLIADVSGKGIPAAMFMMRSKMAFRIFADKFRDSAKILHAVNNYLYEHNEAGMFVTAWLGILDTDTGKVQVSNAGHNLPFKIDVDGNLDFVTGPISLVLGGMENTKYRNMEMQLHPGEKLLLYTDGITEANNNEKELYGEKRLIRCLSGFKGNDLKEISEHLISNVEEFVDGAEQFDDMTTLALIYKGEKSKNKHMKIEVKAKTKSLTEITNFVDDYLKDYNCNFETIENINVAIDEIFSNIVKHGYDDETKDVEIEIKVDELNRIVITFIDEAKKFNPLDIEEPDTTLSAEECDIGGLGIFMVRKMMDEVNYEYKDKHNILTIKKKIN
ncbi:MAG: SpoIIE family protein phosphatase [Coriobacteriia bacterium]|nr:SpoIIE family protein phosphatase [Coriobacteriia bacterium]